MILITNDGVFNGEKEIIGIYLTDADKKNIHNMHSDCRIYAQFPLPDNNEDAREEREKISKYLSLMRDYIEEVIIKNQNES
jgi:hypothetical protein